MGKIKKIPKNLDGVSRFALNVMTAFSPDKQLQDLLDATNQQQLETAAYKLRELFIRWLKVSGYQERENQAELDELGLICFENRMLKHLNTIPISPEEFYDMVHSTMELFMHQIGATNFTVWKLDASKKEFNPTVSNQPETPLSIGIETHDNKTKSALNQFLRSIEGGNLSKVEKGSTAPAFGNKVDGTFSVLFPSYNASGLFDSFVSFYFDSKFMGLSKEEIRNLNISEEQKTILSKERVQKIKNIKAFCCAFKDKFADIIERFRANYHIVEELQKVGLEDPLTGINNRRYLDTCLNQKVKESLRDKQPFSFLLIDIDFFKKVNDTYGHLAGDLVLKKLAETLQNRVRESDVLARYGGEEFAVVLKDTDSEQAKNIAEKFRKRIEGLVVDYEGKKIKITISVGVLTFSKENNNVLNIVNGADRALYQAKEDGRNRVVVCETGCECLAGQAKGARGVDPAEAVLDPLQETFAKWCPFLDEY